MSERARAAVTAGVWAGLVSLGLGLFLVLFPAAARLGVYAWLLAMAIIVGSALVRLALAGWPERDASAMWPVRRHRVRRQQVAQLEELERLTEFATGTAFDFHYRLRPRLCLIAEHRLAHHGVRLASQPERARALLGAEVWELLRPDRPPPADRHGPGLPVAARRQIVEVLDAL